jgi:hypothetical protein
MKNIINIALLLFLPCLCFGSDSKSFDDVRVIVKPEKSLILPGEEIDLEIIVYNQSGKVATVPESFILDGYDNLHIDFDADFFLVSNDGFKVRGTAHVGMGPPHLASVPLKPLKFKKYRIKWIAPDKDFDFIALSATLSANGELISGETTLTANPQQNAAGQPATRPLSK